MTMSPTGVDDQDRLTRFLIDAAGVRGVLVHLDDTWRQIRDCTAATTDDQPLSAANRLLGQAAAAAALFTGHAKVDGRLSVQLRSNGALRTLFAECTAAGTLRGIVQLSEDGEVPSDLRALGADAVLAITIENPSIGGREPMRYQGMVSLQSGSLAGAFEDYFRQSEQLPTRLLLAAEGARAAGLMLQKLPGDTGDEDGWNRAVALFDTLKTHELLDCPSQTLLARLFHEDGVQVLATRPLQFACSCSRERVSSMLVSLGQDEAQAALADGTASIRCEFCGQDYRFGEDEIVALFTSSAREVAAPDRLQ